MKVDNVLGRSTSKETATRNYNPPSEENRIDSSFPKLRTALLLGALLLGSASAQGQDLLGATLSGDLALRAVPDVYLAPRMPSTTDLRARFFLYGERYDAFTTHRGRETQDRYVANGLDAGLDLPVRLGRRDGLLQARLPRSHLDGLLDHGALPSSFDGFELALTRDLSSRLALGLAVRRRGTDADYASDVLKSTFQGFGVDPDIDLNLRESSVGVQARYALPGLTADLGVGRTDFNGDASVVGNDLRLALPLDMGGTELSFALDHPVSPTSTLGLHLRRRRLDGEDRVRREGGRAVGDGEARLSNDLVSLSLDQQLANGGRLLYGLERATTRFDADGLVPDAADASIDAPAGATVLYRASAGVGRTEAAFRWEAPQRRGRLTLGYRQALVQADASVGYGVRLFLFGVQGDSGQRLKPTQAGIFDVAYARTFHAYDARISLQQVVPYVFGDGKSGSGGGSGGSSHHGPSAQTSGGWTIGLLIGRRF